MLDIFNHLLGAISVAFRKDIRNGYSFIWIFGSSKKKGKFMRLKYCGGRSRYEVSLNRKPYYFTPENKMILETQDQNVVNYIFSLDNRQEFEVVMEEPQPQAITPEVEKEEVKEPIIITTIKKLGRPKKGRK